MKKLTGRILGLQFMSNNSVVIDTTLGLKPFPRLAVQVKPPQKGVENTKLS